MKPIKQILNLAAIGLSLLAVNSHATLRTWSGGATDGTWTNALNWDVLPAVNGDSLTFSGTAQQNNTNTYTAITNTAITLATGGWVLNGNPVTLGGNVTSSTGTNVVNNNLILTGTRTMSVTAGQLTLNGVVSGAFGLTSGGAGNLVLAGSNTCSGTITVAAGAGNVIVTNPKGLGTGSVSIPHAGTSTGILKLQLSGSNTIANTFSGFGSANSGATGIPQIENVSGTNTITSALTVTATGGNGLLVQADTGGLLILNGVISTTQNSRLVQLYGAGNGVVNGFITNGTGTSFPLTKLGAGTWTLNGTNTFTGGCNIAQGTLALGPNGLILNATPISLSAGSTFDVSAVSAGWVLPAGKTLSGTGSVVGNVATSSGTPSTIAPGAAATQGVLIFSNNLTLNDTTVLGVNLSSDPTGVTKASDLVVVAGNLTANGTTTITLGSYLNGFINNGTYHIIQYAGTFTGSAANFAVTGFTAGGRGVQNGYVVVNPGYVDLVVTGTPPAQLTWSGDGAANNWDIATGTDWLNGGSADLFYNYDSVTFDDTATNFTVNLNTTVIPGVIVVNATNNYTIGGASAVISGATGITKTNSGTLTLSGVNTFTGSTLYNGGAIATATIGNNVTASPIGMGGQSINGGTLEYTGAGESNNRSFGIGAKGGTVQVDNPAATLIVSGSGVWNGSSSLTKTGPGTLYFSLQQNLTGTNYINGGILKIAALAVFGTDVTSPLFINGGALDINAQNMSTKPVIVSGMGDLAINGNTNGAIVNSGGSQTQGFQFVTMTGDTAFGGTGRWDIRANSTASLSTGGNPYNLIKVGANFIGLVSVTVDPALADIDVRAGTLSYELATTGLGNPANTLSVRNGAVLDFWAAATPLNKPVVLYDGSAVTAGSGSSTIISPVNLAGDTAGGVTFGVASGVTLNLNGVVSGAGTLTKTNTGTLVLGATNTYTGITTVAGGKLVANAAINRLGTIAVNDGAIFSVTAAGARQLQVSSLTMGNGGSGATNEFTLASSTTIAPLHVTNLTLSSPVVINIPSGNFFTGQTYPLLTYDNVSGGGSFVLGTLPPLVTATLVTSGNTVSLNVSAAVSLESWSGSINNLWDINTTPNWSFNGSPTTFLNGNGAKFDDTALSNTTINVTATVQPSSLIFNNNSKNYAFNGSGGIAGTVSLIMSGSGAVTLNNANSYTGGTILNSGTLNIDNNGALGSGILTINGGTIDNNGSGSVTLANNLVQKWSGDFAYAGNQDLNLGTGAVTLSTNRTVTVNGSATLSVGGITDNGSNYMLTVNGSGILAVTRPSTYANGTLINGGTMVVQGDQTAANGGFIIGTNNTGGALTVPSGASVLINTTNPTAPGQVQVGSIVSVSGTTTIPLTVAGAVTNNGFLQIGRAGTLTVATNGVWVQNNAMQLLTVGGYLGQVNVAAGGTFIYNNSSFTVQLNNLAGATLPSLLNVSGLFITPVGFEAVNGLPGTNRLQLSGGGILRLTAPIADLTSVNTADSVQFVLGAGGGSIDTAGNNSGLLGNIIGAGGLTKAGAGTLTLSAANTYTGNTTVSGGTLALSGAASIATSTNVIVNGGATLDVSAIPFALVGQVLSNTTTTATVNGNVDATAGAVGLTYTAGTPAFNITGGTLTLSSTNSFKVSNAGASLANGSYKLISVGGGGAVAAAGTLPLVTVGGNGMGVGATASLGITNSELYLVVVGGSAVNTNPTNLIATVSGGVLQLSWPTDHTGWRLLVQTNNLASGVSANTNDWTTVPGSTSIHSTNITINPAMPTEFYRLVYP